MPTKRLTVAKILLGPVLVVQGRRVRRTTPRLPEADGPRRRDAQAKDPFRILIVGDSSAAGVGATTQDEALLGALGDVLAAHHPVEIDLVAKTGLRTSEMVAFLRANPVQPPYDVAVTALGVNDITAQVGLRQWLVDQAELRAYLTSTAGVRATIVSGIPPMANFPALPFPLRWFLGRQAHAFDHAHAASLAHDDTARFVKMDFFPPHLRMASDGFHPSPAVYRAWAERLAADLLEVLPAVR